MIAETITVSSNPLSRTFEYDPRGKLYKQTLDSNADATVDTQAVFVRADDQIAPELEKSGTGNLPASDLKTRQLWLPRSVDHHLAQEEISSGDLFWSLPDHFTAGYKTGSRLQTLFWVQELNGRVSVFDTVRDVVEYVSTSDSYDCDIILIQRIRVRVSLKPAGPKSRGNFRSRNCEFTYFEEIGRLIADPKTEKTPVDDTWACTGFPRARFYYRKIPNRFEVRPTRGTVVMRG